MVITRIQTAAFRNRPYAKLNSRYFAVDPNSCAPAERYLVFIRNQDRVGGISKSSG